MSKRFLTVLAICLLPSAASAGLAGAPSNSAIIQQFSADAALAAHVSGRKAFMRVHRSGTRKKSDRQKCLDMMLPQDGADCMKKLKAKKNNN
ncbi:MAG: hypothetical protein AAGB04_25045 [Pseudomonadota bacterium]